ncbi:hypothetical protein PtA15_16A285 [Puccinia triticina]|uniref:PEBP-like protein n=1 Tax=Puccinia triticina TaxID=208348 RepID=A0ABY7D437_9BASI|nr:uncharacterized protein PtA15_16A285 [Puccinia triticina]WAQ92378.1 hypothetical protein PtA15_16A285 [Puccinia triticina]
MKVIILSLLYWHLCQSSTAQTPVPGPLPGQPTQAELSGIRQAFVRDGIVPDVLADFDPQMVMSVAYPSGTLPSETVIQPGQSIPEKLGLQQPQVFLSIPQAGSGQFNLTHPSTSEFTLLIVDPDAPSRKNPSSRAFLHLLATKVRMIPDSVISWRYKLEMSAEVVVPYMPPQPPAGTGPHRYVFLLCPGLPAHASTAPLQRPTTSRAGFNTQEFISQSGLHQPIAGTFVQIQHTDDDS